MSESWRHERDRVFGTDRVLEIANDCEGGVRSGGRCQWLGARQTTMYANGTMVPASLQPPGSKGPTNSSEPSTNSGARASPIGHRADRHGQRKDRAVPLGVSPTAGRRPEREGPHATAQRASEGFGSRRGGGIGENQRGNDDSGRSLFTDGSGLDSVEGQR